MSRVITWNQNYFSNIIIREDKKKLDKHKKDVNVRMKNFCEQKDIGLIDNYDLDEYHLGS